VIISPYRPAWVPDASDSGCLPGFAWDRKDCTALTLLPVSLVIKLTDQLVSSCGHVLTQQLQIRAGLLPTHPRRGPAAERVRVPEKVPVEERRARLVRGHIT
jgi:hypothetical protein